MTQAPEQSTAKGWMPDDSTFGARLALVRQRMGWGNVSEAAKACGIPVESWRTWERDGVEPRRIVEMSKLISLRTGCNFGWLLAGQSLAGSGDKGDYMQAAPPVEAKRTDPLAPRPIARSARPDPVRPSAARGSSRRPAGARPTVLPRPR